MTSVKDEVSNVLSDQFAVVLDGLQGRDSHSIAMSAMLPFNYPYRHSFLLLPFASMASEENLNANMRY